METFNELIESLNAMPYGIAVFFIVATGLLYFLPSFVAMIRDHKHGPAIFIVNLLLGWSGLFWVLSLAYGFINTK